MKRFFVLSLLLFVHAMAACGGSESEAKNTSAAIQASTPELAADAVVQAMANLEQKSGAQLEAFTRMFNVNGVRFCPYYRTENADRILTAERFIEEFENPQAAAAQWGTHDGSGEPIEMNLRGYWRTYVWDQPYTSLSTPHAIGNPNDFQGTGNMINNLFDTFPAPQYRIVEYYQPGQDPELDGMDWTSLIVVLHDEGQGRWTLAAIAHGSWTI